MDYPRITANVQLASAEDGGKLFDRERAAPDLKASVVNRFGEMFQPESFARVRTAGGNQAEAGISIEEQFCEFTPMTQWPFLQVSARVDGKVNGALRNLFRLVNRVLGKRQVENRRLKNEAR